MHVLLVARDPASDVEERWANLGIGSTAIAHTSLLYRLSAPQERAQLVADEVVIVCDRVTPLSGRPTDFLDGVVAVELAIRIRQLDEVIAMPDGRRWSAVPIRILATSTGFAATEAAVGSAAAKAVRRIFIHELSRTDNFAADAIKADVKKYRQDVLNELDNLGFVVAYEGGRYRLGPALKPRPELVGHYYFGPADKRPDHFVTIDRDMVGVQLEVEALESLLNKQDASEADFQRFFEDHPHFLSQLAIPMPHVQLRDGAGKLLVPDFILKPVVATQRDSRWEVLDLKKPQVPLLVGKGTRRQLSHAVQKAITQLREYGDYFSDPRNTSAIEHALGHRLRRPKMGVLIGRMIQSDTEALELEQSRLPDVRIITYDEILDQQKVLIS